VAEGGGPFGAALAGQRILVVQVMLVIGNPANPAPGALIGYVPIDGRTHTTVERWTDGLLTCGVLGEKRLTIALQPRESDAGS
jgi:hypothetical protein